MKTVVIYEDDDIIVINKPTGLATQTSKVGEPDVVSELKNYLAARSDRNRHAGRGNVPEGSHKEGYSERSGKMQDSLREKASRKEPGSGKENLRERECLEEIRENLCERRGRKEAQESRREERCRKEVQENLHDKKRHKETGLPYLGIVHRLDQPVEGLLVFAKNQKAAAELSRQLGEQVNKRYYGVFCGKPLKAEGELTDYLVKGADARAVVADEGTQGAKKAVLRYKVVETVETEGGDILSLADIHIETGRFHQIRAQMAHGGMALLGDAKYGDETTLECSRRLGVRTAALCAYRLDIRHPISGEELHFQIPPKGRAFSFFEI